MCTPFKILIVDDDPDFLRAYRLILEEEEGYSVEQATRPYQALEKLRLNRFDVVLVDQKLQGPGGPDLGLDLIREIRQLEPGIQLLLVTAYADPRLIQRALEEGAADYLEKNGRIFDAVLKAKIRMLHTLQRERRHSRMSREQADLECMELWNALQHETDSNRKGHLLEELMGLLLKSIPGWSTIDQRRRNEVEEIDLVIQNESQHPTWSKESALVLVECKNWSKPIGVEEFTRFRHKLETKFGRARVGLLVALGGSTNGVRQEMLSARKESLVILLLDRTDLETLLNAPDRNQTLLDFYRRALLVG